MASQDSELPCCVTDKMTNFWKRFIKIIIQWFVDLIFIPVSFVVAAAVGGVRWLSNCCFKDRTHRPAIVWGSAPIKNNCYWSRSVRELGFRSETFTTDFYYIINDRVVPEIFISH